MVFARRIGDGPIITPADLPGDDGVNINGPSAIAAPDWLPNRLGRFYLYFAHHHGRYIRLAYADHIEGPWTIHAPGTLSLADVTGLCRDHMASPEMIVDHDRREILMYFHACEADGKRQRTYLAVSSDGIAFRDPRGPLAPFYLRTMPWRGQVLGLAKGIVCLSPDGRDAFRELDIQAFPDDTDTVKVRHTALRLDGDRLHVIWSRSGDALEHLLHGTIDLSRPEDQWRIAGVTSLLRPEHPWEGADLPVAASKEGAAKGREHALRDPALLAHDGRHYLFYSVAGESGIAVAEVTFA